jgi:hypothetical protein
MPGYIIVKQAKATLLSQHLFQTQLFRVRIAMRLVNSNLLPEFPAKISYFRLGLLTAGLREKPLV